jgi:catechol 2,3-dioxygenase-like lactoylglutathione lyase family enzyme
MVHVSALDHVVLLVADARRSVAWYHGKLGLEPERLVEFEAGEVLFPSLRIDPHTVIDLLETPPEGHNVDHVCLVVDGPSVERIASSPDFDVVEGPVERWGARGMARSTYVRDPDGHLIELRAYPD